MKHSIALLILFAFVSADTVAQTHGLDNTDPSVFSQFRIPKTDLSALWFNTGLNYSSNKYSILMTDGPNQSRFNSNFVYTLSPQYYLLKESDNQYLSINCAANGSYQNQYEKYEGNFWGMAGYAGQTNNQINLTVNGVYRNYAPGSDLFYSVSSSDQFNLSAHYGYSSPTISASVPYSGYKTQSYSFLLGLGWGKMRNVTSVVSAIRFQERMKQLNLLGSDLSEKTIEDLAQQFYRNGYYSDVHVRSDKFFWQDVENTLSGDGISLSGLNQYADSYLREVPNELRFMRSEGMLVGLNLQVEYDNTYSSFVSYNSGITEELYTLANAYVQYSHQLNLNSQFAFSLSLSGGPNVVKDSPIMQEYIAGGSVGYNYELTDRIVTSVSDAFNVIFRNAGKQTKNLVNNASAGVNYFVEDNISVAASYSWNYNDVKSPSVSSGHTVENDNCVSVGLTYYIDRGFMYK